MHNSGSLVTNNAHFFQSDYQEEEEQKGQKCGGHSNGLTTGPQISTKQHNAMTTTRVTYAKALTQESRTHQATLHKKCTERSPRQAEGLDTTSPTQEATHRL
jgi:hypothetical protein